MIGLYAKDTTQWLKNVAAAGITPTSDKQFLSSKRQNNKWNNKFYFNAGTSDKQAKLGVTDGTDAGTF